jgi:hypothetical protein
MSPEKANENVQMNIKETLGMLCWLKKKKSSGQLIGSKLATGAFMSNGEPRIDKDTVSADWLTVPKQENEISLWML